LNKHAQEAILDLLVATVRAKIANYSPETIHMPFHHRLLGRDRYAMFSFVHSMNTTFGMSIWEQVAKLLVEASGGQAVRQFKLEGQIDEKTEALIRAVHHSLREAKSEPNKESENSQVQRSIQQFKGQYSDPDRVVDLVAVLNGTENYFDIISAKPNIKEFSALKLKLLRWTGLRLSQDKRAQVMTRLGVPYNPYHPEPYERWTLRGIFDLKRGEILVGQEFWDFVADEPVYDQLLSIFQKAGEILRPELDARFSKFR
jgi:hypothetical protein